MENYALGSLLFLLFLVLIVLALGGNLLVCVAVYLDRNLRRQPENLYLVSLAVSDLLVSALVMVFAAANDLLSYWPFGRVYCHFWICLDIVCCSASILNLCAISLDRYWHISRPMLYVRYCSRKRICIAICLVWLLSVLIGTLQLAFGFARADLNISAYDGSLEFPTCQMNLPPLYAIGSSLLSFFLPATLMVLFYTRLYLYARKHVRSIRSQLRQATSFLIMQLASEKIREVTQATLNGEKLHVDDKSARKNLTQFSDGRHVQVGKTKLKATGSSASSVSDQKARLTLGVIMGTFLICWMPFFIVNIWKSLYPHGVSHTYFQAVTWLGYANSTANPLIYSIFNRDFRRAFKKIISYFVHCEQQKMKNRGFYANNGKQCYRNRSPKNLREEPLWSLSSDDRPQSSNPNASSFPLESETLNNNISNGVIASCNGETVQLRSLLHESSNRHLSSFSNNNNNEDEDESFSITVSDANIARLHSSHQSG
ncbi:hypothetical protein QR680_002202 [Steinernema hermaphroditum]|uniref:G-protein coupled receptors family 1 profile domain-containing protein n=1 Tax=Steinernema hermaphroditum TaxID=289476 RepID=A0AA39H2P0_9BILA|nr:hypothetical protein QR680_002202 [Steinernema hermaphroditum]